MIIKCKSCNFNIDNGSKFCPNCGEKVVQSSFVDTPKSLSSIKNESLNIEKPISSNSSPNSKFDTPAKSLSSSTNKVNSNSTNKYDINLIRCGEKKINVIKVIRDYTGIGLAEAKNLIDSVPVVIPLNISQESVNSLLNDLIKAEANAVIVPSKNNKSIIKIQSTTVKSENNDTAKKTEFFKKENSISEKVNKSAINDNSHHRIIDKNKQNNDLLDPTEYYSILNSKEYSHLTLYMVLSFIFFFPLGIVSLINYNKGKNNTSNKEGMIYYLDNALKYAKIGTTIPIILLILSFISRIIRG